MCSRIIRNAVSFLVFCISIPVIIGEWIAIVFYNKFRKVFLNYPPGPCPLPLFGNSLSFRNTPLQYLAALKIQYGPIASIYLGQNPAVVVSNAEYIKQLKQVACNDKPDLLGYTEGRICGGQKTGVVCTNGRSYERSRKFLIGTLNDMRVKGKTEEAVLTEMEELIKDWYGRPRGLIEVTNNLFNTTVTNSLWNIASGQRFELDEPDLCFLVGALSRYVHEAGRCSSLSVFPWLSSHLGEWSRLPGYKYNIEVIMKFFENKFDKFGDLYDDRKKEVLHQKPSLIRDYFKKCERVPPGEGPAVNVEELRTNMITTLGDLFICGTETVSTTISWAIYYLVAHPEVQKELYGEIIASIGDDEPTLESMKRMPYSRGVISEVLRCASVVPVAPCHVTTEKIALDKYEIPINTLVIPNLYGSNFDAKYWGSDESVFNPDRFIDYLPPNDGEEGPARRVYREGKSFLSFSTGARSCIGRVMALDFLYLILVSIVLNFELFPDDFEVESPESGPRTLTNSIENLLVLEPKPFTVKAVIRKK